MPRQRPNQRRILLLRSRERTLLRYSHGLLVPFAKSSGYHFLIPHHTERFPHNFRRISSFPRFITRVRRPPFAPIHADSVATSFSSHNSTVHNHLSQHVRRKS